MEKYKKVTLRVHTGSSIRNQGQAYPDAITALCEPIRNSLKVGADHITVDLYPDCIIIRDRRGLGMVPFMFPDDEKIVNAYFERGIDLEELAKKLTFPSAHSLQWLAQCIALSSNYVTNEPGGLKGVGNIAYMNYADQQIVVSRPRLDLAKMYWGTDMRDESLIPAFVFVPPTLSEIDANKLTGIIIATDKLDEPEYKSLKASLGSAAQITGCGTKITIRKLRIDVLKSLHPKLRKPDLSRKHCPGIMFEFSQVREFSDFESPEFRRSIFSSGTIVKFDFELFSFDRFPDFVDKREHTAGRFFDFD